jgi:hypothetical protein
MAQLLKIISTSRPFGPRTPRIGKGIHRDTIDCPGSNHGAGALRARDDKRLSCWYGPSR